MVNYISRIHLCQRIYLHSQRTYLKMIKGPFNFVSGKRISPSNVSTVVENINPAINEVLCSVPCSGKDDVNNAVQAAHSAFTNWCSLSSRSRGQYLLSTAKIVRSRLEEIAQLEVLDTGKPIWEARVDIAGCADTLEYYGGVATSIRGDYYTLEDNNFAYTRREPLGVVAGIGAWNYPFQVMTWKVAPALACGNTFVYKPSEFTPVTSVVLAEIFSEAGVPPGVVNIVQGDKNTGEYLTLHPDVAKVTFTGSVQTGKHIMKACADGMKKVTLELGGKSALLVFSDCDIVNAVKATLLGNFLTQGEVCTNCTRVFVEESILKEFQDQLVVATKKLIIGNPKDDKTMVGAMITHEHGSKVLKYIEEAKIQGAKVLCGGERIKMQDGNLKGCFISPCVISNCVDDMTFVKEEIFGSVVSILPFNDEETAVRRANSSSYGLAAGIMTKDLQRAHRVASSLQVGIVWINNYNVFPPELPFGGYKMSGIGRENGLAALKDFTQLKTVYVEGNSEIPCPLFLK